MSDLEETASNEPNSPERERSRSPRHRLPPPPPPAPLQAVENAVVNLVGDLARRTCPECMRLFDSAKAMWGHSWVHKERRDQIYAMPPPGPIPPPPPAAGNGSLLAVGGGSGGGPIGWHPWTIDSRDERDRTCPKCMKVFASPKGMYGHLHVHYEKGPKTPKPGSSQAGPSAPPPPPPPPPPPRAVEDDSPVTSIDLNRLPEEDDPMLLDLNLTPPSD